MNDGLRQTRVFPPHLHERDEIEVPDAVVILSCQTFVRSLFDPVALSPSTQIAPAHGDQMFVLGQARFRYVPCCTYPKVMRLRMPLYLMPVLWLSVLPRQRTRVLRAARIFKRHVSVVYYE